MGLGDPFSEAQTQRLQVVNMYKCSLGIHSRELCQSYASAQATAGSVLAETGQTINDNMGCTERWEQQGNDPTPGSTSVAGSPPMLPSPEERAEGRRRLGPLGAS